MYFVCILYLEAKLHYNHIVSYKSSGDFWELWSLPDPSLKLRACRRRQNPGAQTPFCIQWLGPEHWGLFGESVVPSTAHCQKCTVLPLVCSRVFGVFSLLTCWFAPSCSTWRLWPMSTLATVRSSTVWTSWSTWRVSAVVGTQPTFPTRSRNSSRCL